MGSNIGAITNGSTVMGTVTREVERRVDVLLDCDTNTDAVELDSVSLASGVTFRGDNGPCKGAGLGLWCHAMLFDAFDTFGAFGALGDELRSSDNVLIQSMPTVPKPANFGLAMPALLLADYCCASASRRGAGPRTALQAVSECRSGASWAKVWARRRPIRFCVTPLARRHDRRESRRAARSAQRAARSSPPCVAVAWRPGSPSTPASSAGT